VQHALNSPFCFAQAQKHTNGVSNQALGLARMVKIALPLPPLDEQRAIADEVDRRLAVIKKVQAQVDANLKRADLLCQGILKRAFEGRLVSQNSTDEPADTRATRNGIRGNRPCCRAAVTPAGESRPGGRRPREKGFY
jgi:type I restriction enzyme S subunit